jgi:hypothetical protein
VPHEEGTLQGSPDVATIKDPFVPPRSAADTVEKPQAWPLIPDGSPVEPLSAVDGDGCEGGLRRDQQPDASRHAGAGSLIVVNMGIMAISHVTIEGQRWIELSDKVLYVGVDPVVERWIGTRGATPVSLNGLGDPNKSALQIGNELVEQTLDYVRAGLSVCAAFHGHSTAFRYAAHESIRRCRAEGYRAAMLPGVSPEDCLIADLGLDLTHGGCQIFDCCDFLERRRQPDTSAGLILSLPSLVGDTNNDTNSDPISCDPALVAVLRAAYGPDHEVILHGPAQYAVCDPIIRRCRVAQLAGADITAVSSLYVPPKRAPAEQPDSLRLVRAGVDAPR